MRERSPELDQLATALAAAQVELPTIPKTKTGKVTGVGKSGPYEYSYQYADLADVQETAGPVVTRHGLSVAQFPSHDGTAPTLVTYLLHKSGQFIADEMRLLLGKEDPQGQGSGITYARRYAYCAALGIVADKDDDGQAAMPEQGSRGRQASSRGSGRGQSSTAGSTAAPATGGTITGSQLKFMMGNFTKLGISDEPADYHEYIEKVVGHAVATSKDLTTAEASKVIDQQRTDLAYPATEQPTFGGYDEEPF